MAIPTIVNKRAKTLGIPGEKQKSNSFKVPALNKSEKLTPDTVPAEKPAQIGNDVRTKLLRNAFIPINKSESVKGYLSDHSIGGMSIDDIVNNINKTIYIDNSSNTVSKNFNRMSTKYNRFKAPTVNSMLQKGFAHLFFVRPACNILTEGLKLKDGLQGNNLFRYAIQSKAGSRMLLDLSPQKSGPDFIYSLSNSAISFSPQDEYIGSDTYGKGYTGYKIAYGKSNIESRTAGSFDVEFQDDRDMHIYQFHKLWEEYISCVFRGEAMPTVSHIKNKILDYTGALYYIITAEDGETIIFWTKYYGIFPTTAPTTHLAWSSGNVISGESTRFSVTYQFSFKNDFDPIAISEFNKNAHVESTGNYIPIYDPKLGHAGRTWVGKPFIETVTTSTDFHYVLRFRPPS